jgi:hypothetical protein
VRISDQSFWSSDAAFHLYSGGTGFEIRISDVLSKNCGFNILFVIHNLFSHQHKYFHFSSPPHDMFRPQTAIIRRLKYAKTVALYKMYTYSRHT